MEHMNASFDLDVGLVFSSEEICDAITETPISPSEFINE